MGHRGRLMVSGRGLVRPQVQALGLRLGPQTLKPPLVLLLLCVCTCAVCRFPTIVIFASGSGIATAAALIESPVGVCTHISPKLRGDVRVYYLAPNR